MSRVKGFLQLKTHLLGGFSFFSLLLFESLAKFFLSLALLQLLLALESFQFFPLAQLLPALLQLLPALESFQLLLLVFFSL